MRGARNIFDTAEKVCPTEFENVLETKDIVFVDTKKKLLFTKTIASVKGNLKPS